MKVTRRQLLAGIGATGAASFGSRALGRRPAYTQYTYAQSAEPSVDLRVAWYELYNGERQEHTPDGLSLTDNTTWKDAANDSEYVNVGTQSDSSEESVDAGPVLALTNVLPGDSGTLVIGLHSELAPAAVTIRAFGPGLDGEPVFAENGRNEPEARVDTDDVGELGEKMQASVWYDDGLAGFGAGDGRTILSGVFEQTIATGTLSEVLTKLASEGESGLPLADYGCFERGSPRYVGFSWELPHGVGNGVQGDSASFGLAFGAVACDDTGGEA